MNNGIQIIYPRTKYEILNKEICEFLKREVLKFLNKNKSIVLDTVISTLDIAHDEYVYKNYLSVVFYLSCDNLNEIYTIVYDKEENKIVSISDLVKEKPSILSILSTKSRKILANNKNIKKLSLMMKWTEEIEDNFLHFVFAPTGIMLYFSSGQVTDKEYGIIKVVVPYEDIKKDSN